MHIQMYPPALFCQHVSECLRCSEHSVALLMNPSALSPQSLTSLTEGQLNLFVSFCIPTRTGQGMEAATILICASVLLSRFSLLQIDLGLKT